MRARTFLVIAAVLLVLGQVGGLYASPITGFNTVRPVSILPPSVNTELTLQQILDNNFGGINAATDQQKAAVFSTSGNPPGAAQMFPVLLAEFSGNAAIQTFGIWSATDTTGPIHTAEIFAGVASPFATAQVAWQTATTGLINGTTAFSDIPFNFFGFYYKFGNTTLYTYDDLNAPQTVGGNNHKAAILAYKTASGDAWIFACDDLGVEPDYNDMVVKVESIHQVPLPPTALLLFSGLVGLGLLGRRRSSKG